MARRVDKVLWKYSNFRGILYHFHYVANDDAFRRKPLAAS